MQLAERNIFERDKPRKVDIFGCVLKSGEHHQLGGRQMSWQHRFGFKTRNVDFVDNNFAQIMEVTKFHDDEYKYKFSELVS